MGRRGLIKGGSLAALAVLAIYALLGGDLGQGDGSDAAKQPPATTTSTSSEAGTGTAAAEAPAGLSEEEAAGIRDTLDAIRSGDLPYDQDGTTFQNREGNLPDRPEGYYREYTVVTPGSDDRGARRLVIGAEGETFYTGDHYDSFTEIDPADFGGAP